MLTAAFLLLVRPVLSRRNRDTMARSDPRAVNLKSYAQEPKQSQEAQTAKEHAEDDKRATALYQAGIQYRDQRSRGAALDSFRASAKLGNVDAMNALAICYKDGFGVNKDRELALSWFNKAAAGGSPEAMHWLGKTYTKGDGVPMDEGKGFDWFLKSANAGFRDAMNSVGVCYEEGSGTAKDEAKAVAWLRRGADLGDPTAMYNLGLMYGKGQGLPKSPIDALSWMRRAASAGQPDATAFVAEFDRELSKAKERQRLKPILELWDEFIAAENEEALHNAESDRWKAAAQLADSLGDVSRAQESLNKRAEASQAALSAAVRAKYQFDKLAAYDPIDRANAAKIIVDDPKTPRNMKERLQPFLLPN
jgi:TPR repeat protein